MENDPRLHFVIPHQNGGGLTKFGELPCTLPALVVTGVGWVSWAIVRVDSRTGIMAHCPC